MRAFYSLIQRAASLNTMQVKSMAQVQAAFARPVLGRTVCSAQVQRQLPSLRSTRGGQCMTPRLQRICHSNAALPLRARFTTSAAATAEPAADAPAEEHQYQAEVDRLMDMIVNSLYSNREVFLRELVSNASDALDKRRFLSLTDQDPISDGDALEIRIRSDPSAGTITIEDTGVGMTKDDLLSSLGTIARSGTAKFAEAMKERKNDANLIGQFGVGFYSSFLVADRVQVQTKHKDDSQWRWESAAGAHSFRITEDKSGDLSRGTRITLFLKEDAKELADEKKLGELIKQYSEFIQFPIRLWQSSVKTEETVDEEATAKKRQEAVDAAKAKGEDADKVTVEPVKKSNKTTEWDWAVQNSNKPIWTRSPKEVTDEEYNSFFKATFKEFLEPAAHTHFNVEGTIEFSALLYIPGMAPFEEQSMMGKSKNIKLFVKRVFISDEFDDNLLPRYLTFVKGIVDSSDLPLNVSREILQESRIVRTIKKQLVRRTLDMLMDISKRPAKAPESGEGEPTSEYELFWESFGKFIKLGVLDDSQNKDTLGKLLRFSSSKSGDKLTSLQEVVSRMQPNQKDIYFVATETKEAAESSPFVERLSKKDFEVLYLTEAIDEPTITALEKFDGRTFVDVSREGLDLGDEEEDKKKAEEAATALKGLTDFMKEKLGSKVEKVAVSSRLSKSPCALVTSKFGWSAAQERLMKAQAMADARAAEYMKGRKVLEINPSHPIIQSLNDNYSGDERNASAVIDLLYDTSLVTSGFTVDSPKAFADRIYDMIAEVTGSDRFRSDASNNNEPVEAEILDGNSSNDPWKQ